jgi:hypothetical protein
MGVVPSDGLINGVTTLFRIGEISAILLGNRLPQLRACSGVAVAQHLPRPAFEKS